MNRNAKGLILYPVAILMIFLLVLTFRDRLEESQTWNDRQLESALEGAQYQMIRRGGFIHNPADTGAPRKKRGQCVFQAGSTFRTRFGGELSAVGTSAGQTVYRYNHPLWLGVKL